MSEGPGDVNYNVTAHFKADTANHEAGVERVAAASSRLRAETARAAAAANESIARVQAGAGRVGAVIDRVLGTALRIGGALSGTLLAGGLHALTQGIGRLNAEAESTGITLAGMMQANGATGSWGQSMRVAGDVMSQIRRDANELPGEAQDFIEVFRGGLPRAIASGMTDPAAIARFTNRMGAVGIAHGIDAQQIGRDTNLMLMGHAGAQVRMWGVLEPIIGRTAHQFNAMTAPERVRALDGALGHFRPMIAAYGDTWETATSTARGHLRDLLRVGSAPLFSALKSHLQGANHWFEANEARALTLARTVGYRLAGAFDRVQQAVVRVGGAIEHLHHTAPGGLLGLARDAAGRAAHVGGGLLAARAGAGLLASPVGGMMLRGIGGLAGASGAGVGLAGAGVAAAIIIPVAVAIATGGERVRVTLAQLATSGAQVVGSFTHLAVAATPLVRLVGETMLSAFNSGVQAFTPLITVATGVTTALLGFGNMLASAHLPAWLGGGSNGGGSTFSLPDAAGVALALPFVGALGFAGAAAYRRLQAWRHDQGDVGQVDNGYDDIRGAPGANRDALRAIATMRRENAEDRGTRQRTQRAGGNMHVTVRIEQTINDASDPDRVLVDTRRAVFGALLHPIESFTNEPLR